MCGGPETVHRPRGGALVALSPPRDGGAALASPAAATTMTGDLTFHNPGEPDSAEATHARLSFDEPLSAAAAAALLPSDLHVVIHAGGDLTKTAGDCGLFRQIRLRTRPPSGGGVGAFWEWPLEGTLSLRVGGDGIIGRRVSVYGGEGEDGGGGRRCDRVVLAEGIVGFNSWTTDKPS